MGAELGRNLWAAADFARFDGRAALSPDIFSGGGKMKTIIEDDRTDDELKSHIWLVTATDKFMSGWGAAAGGLSKCAWACKSFGDATRVYDWVKGRSEMKYVNIKTSSRWHPQACHVHIYVVKDNHPALK